MTATDPTVNAMYAALLEAPDGEKDTVALVLADAIEESGEDPARAEFIQVQIALSRIETDFGTRSQVVGHYALARLSAPDEDALTTRESNLLAAHRERWLKVECHECKGQRQTRYWYDFGSDGCPVCKGTGDATRLTEECSYCVGGGQGFSEGSKCIACKGSGQKRQVTFKRGFPFRVEGATMAQLFESENTGIWNLRGTGTGFEREWQPTPLLRLWVTHHPTLEEVAPSDKMMPWHSVDAFGYSFDSEEIHQPSHRVPEVVYDAMTGFDDIGDGWKWYNIREAATTALARAVATVAKELSAPAPK